MSRPLPLPLWRRLWSSLPLAYKMVMFGLSVVMTATLTVMVVTYVSAGDSLKLQLERQVSRDLNVLEAWYRTRLEEMQLSSVGLVRHSELQQAAAGDRLAPAQTLLTTEVNRMHVDFAAIVDRDARLVGPVLLNSHEPAPSHATGPGLRFDPNGLISTAFARKEQVVATEAWQPGAAGSWPVELDHAGLVRLVVTPIGPVQHPSGMLLLGEWLGAESAVPSQVTAMIGGAIALMDHDAVISSNGFPDDLAPAFSPEIWANVREGRYFFNEQTIAGRDFLMAFRPIIDHQGHPVGAVVRGFPESQIGETLQRYAGGIFMLAAAAIVFAMLAFLWLTRQLLFPLRRLATISASLAEGDVVEMKPRAMSNDELGRLESGVVKLADRLMQSREELAEAAVKLEAEAQRLAERNTQLARLNEENAMLLGAIRDHDRLRGQLIERIITAQEDERKRIARELHDETGQSLTGLLVGLKYIEGAQSLEDMRGRTADLKRLTVATLEEVHKLSVALRPAMLDDLGLMVALRSLVKDYGSQHGFETRFHADALEGRLPPLWEVTFYRVVQEALTNIAKYARAKHASVVFTLSGNRLTAVVEDDGVGFAPGSVRSDGREHLGLLGMQERIALIGGEFQLSSAPGKGTRVEFSAELPSLPQPLHALEGTSHEG